MDFYAVLDQIIALLQQRGRVSYQALKRQFGLDDTYINDLKVELIDAQQMARDDNGRVLVWVGEAAASPGGDTAATPPAAASTVQDVPPLPTPSAAPQRPDAERRQLTVMFCDLADSTTLSGQLDPEDLRAVLRAYQQTCAEGIQRYEGHIAQYLGDGLLVYFGWPQAHEDDAQRAVHAGTGILTAMQRLNTRLQQNQGFRLAVRIGIHTGPVVVGEIGGGGRHEHLALGDTPNIAARLQGLAAPDSVVISEATFRLVEGYCTCEPLGTQTLKGISHPIPVYHVLGVGVAQSRVEVATRRGLTPLVGREQEVGVLLERWAQVQDGQGQVVLLSGEAGIGKSRLLHVFTEHLAGTPHARLECRSSPYYHDSALYPLTDLLQRALHAPSPDGTQEPHVCLEKLLEKYSLATAETVPLLARLLSIPLPDGRYPPLTMSPQQQRQKTLEALLAFVLAQAVQQPVLFILEDLHWTDPSTLEWLTLLIAQVPTVPLLTLLTCRPEFQPLWGHRSYLTPLALQRFTRAQIETMVLRVTGGKPVPASVMQHLVEKTDGVPLYVEEMTKAILESGVLQETDDHYALTGPLTSLTIPSTLQDALMARLDRLGIAKGVAQLGATIGRQFAYGLLQAVAQMDEATMQQALAQLVEAELLYQRGVLPQATYTFKHALIQDTAYQSLLRSTRQQYHQRIAQVLEARFPEIGATQSELLAHHYTEAGMSEQAVIYWHRAGQHAIERSANAEALTHLKKGLEVLTTLPDTQERLQRELDMQIALCVPLMATTAVTASEVGQAYTRALELCQRAGNTPQLFPILLGLYRFHAQRGEFQAAHNLEEPLLRLTQQQQDPARLMEAHRRVGITRFHQGELQAARTHLEQGLALYNRQQHRDHVFLYGWNDAGVGGLGYYAWTLWGLGYPDQALQRAYEALALAKELSHPLSLAFAWHFLSRIHQYRREGQLAQERAEAAIALSIEHGLKGRAEVGMVLRGWALAEQECGEEGIIPMQQALAALRPTMMVRPYFLVLLAEVYEKIGRIDEGLHVLSEVLTEAHKERDYEAEMHRLKGELLLQAASDNQPEAEACFHKALDVARRQQAKSLELRAATSLARLWRQQGKRQEAYNLLAPVYNWFTEGFDTADLQEAKALLAALA